MKQPKWSGLILWLSGCLLAMSLAAAPAAGRRTIPLDGNWQLAEGQADQVPARFDRTVPVPGLVDMAQPGFSRDTFKNTKRRFGPEDAALAKRSFWYRREFVLQGDVPAVATLLVRRAAYGSTVYLNGTKVGESLASFTANWYDVRGALRGDGATNELLIRVGASRASLPPSVPTGFDYEKEWYIPGLWDSVELALSGTPNLVQVQVVPEIWTNQARVVALVHNAGGPTSAQLKFVVREAKSGKVVGRAESQVPSLAAGADQTVDVRIPIAHCQLWWPEKPFLYTLEVSSETDSFETRFGMREFRFEPRHGDTPGRAWLNGQPCFLRGGNINLYRFFEDPDRGALPWQEAWVRLLYNRFKDMHWNSLRYHLGFAPELWYRLADEEGILIQDEFPIWEGAQRKNWPAELKRDELAREYTAWIKERCNHPCVVIWGAQNESLTTETGAAIEQVRGLDLSNRPWDNGWSPLMSSTDACQAHPYHWIDPHTTLAKALADPVGMPWTDGDCTNPNNRNAYVVSEYGWLWLTRDGKPTTVTKKLYANLAGSNAPPSKLFPLTARLLAAETEYWRCHRQAAGVLGLRGLDYSRPNQPTADHWLDVKHLIWQPDFYRYVRDAFAPVGLMVDFTQERVPAGSGPTQVPVLVINDLAQPWHGPVILRLKCGGPMAAQMKQDYRLGDTIFNSQGWPVAAQMTQPCHLEPWGQTTLHFQVKWPTQTGPCALEAELAGADGKPVRSLRDTQLVDAGSH
ncbi:MAG: hypothetical protein ABSE16_08985 [Verrucomicrobiota bacterium]